VIWLIAVYINGAIRRVPASRIAWCLSCGEWPKGIVRARDGEERNLRPENLILIERGPRPFTNSQVRRASSRHTTPTPAAISLGRIALPQLARRADGLAEIGPGQSIQERDDGLRLVVGQPSVKLRITLSWTARDRVAALPS
jgi:hypothetical protein